MVSSRKALVPLLLAVGIAVGVLGLLLPGSGPVAAQNGPTATRSFSDTSVAPGAEFTVTLTAENYGFSGRVTETLPAGFSYVDGSVSDAAIRATVNGQDVRFTLFEVGNVTFTYDVMASDTPGDDYHFSGVLRDSSRVDHVVGGDNTISVVAGDTGGPGPGNGGGTTPTPSDGPEATRSLSASQAEPGEHLTVTISATSYGFSGRVTETLPSGFAYVDGSVSDSAIRVAVNGQEVRFTLFEVGDVTFSYGVTASDTPGTYDFSGVLRDSQREDHDVIGDSTVVVLAPAGGPTAVRSLSSALVAPGGSVDVTITAENYGFSGRVTETLPSGFAYVDGSVSNASIRVLVSGQDVRFTLFEVGDPVTFTYTATVSSTEGDYTITGVLRDSQRNDYPMESTAIEVGTPPPPPSPSPSPEPSPEPDKTPRPTRTPTPTAIPQVPSTPVPIEKVDVTAVEGATTIQPDASAMVSSADGTATVMLPSTSRARTYQVMVSTDAGDCSGAPDTVQACVTVVSYNAEGDMESDVLLINRATIVIMLDADAVEELGGRAVVLQANAIGAVSVHQDGANNMWSSRRYAMALTDDGGVAVTVTGLRSLGSVALVVDDDLLMMASNQVAGITPTPVPPPPTAVPTATPEPTATATPTDDTPPVGDSTLPVGLLVVLTLTGALMVYTGSRVMRARRSAVR